MTPATWAMALVRRHIGIAAPVDRELREELLNCRQALQRIGRNVNQIARAANKMALADNAAEIAGEQARAGAPGRGLLALSAVLRRSWSRLRAGRRARTTRLRISTISAEKAMCRLKRAMATF